MFGLISKITPCEFHRDPGKVNEFLVNVDQSYSEDFNINEGGWIRNDISAFEMAGSESEKLLFLDRLKELKADDRYKDMTDDEIARFAMPRRALSDPVEYAYYTDSLAKIEFEIKKKLFDDEQKRLEEEKAIKEKAEAELQGKIDSAVQTVSQSPSKA